MTKEVENYTIAELKRLGVKPLMSMRMLRSFNDERLIMLRVYFLNRLKKTYAVDQLKGHRTKVLYMSLEITLELLEDVLNKRHNIDVNRVEPCDEPV